jgi:hypothetical protein
MAKREKIFNVENEEFVLKQIDKLQPLNIFSLFAITYYT